MNSERTSSAAPSECSELLYTTVGDDARYLLMRSMRLVIVVLIEVATVYSLLKAPGHTIMWLADWYVEPGQTSAGMAALGYWFTFVAGLSLVFSVGFPYRYDTTKPGLSARLCRHCRVVVPDELNCHNCKAFRPERIASAALWLASLAVTVLWVIHDVIVMVLSWLIINLDKFRSKK